MSDLKTTTELYGANAAYIAEIYEQFLRNPNSVDDNWKKYFSAIGDNETGISHDFGERPWGNGNSKIVGVADPDAKPAKPQKSGEVSGAATDSIHAHMLIRAYRIRGHLIANLDPLGIAVRTAHAELDPARYGFNEDSYDREIVLDGWLGHEKLTMRQILDILHQTYCSSLTVEYNHIQALDEKEWLEDKFESSMSKPNLNKDEKLSILKRLVETVGFEEFLHKKFPGAKRFSAEGGEPVLPAMEALVEHAAKFGVKEVVLGMPHRGRLNVLTAFMGKPYTAMLSEFQGNLATPDWINSSGDVKYHLGFSSDKKFGENDVHLSLNANPSHLEAVDPVVIGRVRAKQDQFKDDERSQVMGLLLHGDAAFCGQGIVAETLSLSQLEGYKTGGTVHVIVNNQIGFTTMPHEQHPSPYPTDVAMQAQAPIIHVNGDDAEAVLHAARIAAEYRHLFKKDVVIDVWCYRKYGHNEGDEPRWTQPKMYAVIDEKPTPREIYAERLISEGTVKEEEVEKLKSDFYDRLDKAYTNSNNYKPEKADMLEGKWQGIEQAEEGEKPKLETGVKLKTLKDIGKKLSEIPKNSNLHKGVERVLKARRQMIEKGEGLDWAMAEALAFGSLLADGTPVRLSGQDVIRGTFSHRHSGVIDQDTEERIFLLNNIKKDQANYEAINSNLSEFAVLGYEYGYSLAEPNALTLWEGQFGDFANGAQVIFDQFISSGEAKWLRMSGLVVLLPHGYEGQGPEHSSARLERFLQMCADDNMIVANCSTPANYFHILRRQMTRNFRKPLIIMTPKSLLRHKRAQSSLKEMSESTTFKRVIPETEKISANDKVKRVLICSGKVYYDIMEERENRKIKNIAILRLEQFYPFPHNSLLEELVKYKNAETIWVQEEPENMGGWSFVDRLIEAVLVDAKGKSKRTTVISRKASASPAAGYMRIHQKEQQEIIDKALTL